MTPADNPNRRKLDTDAKARKRHYARRRQEGQVLVPIWMTPATKAQLDALARAGGDTFQGVVSTALDRMTDAFSRLP